jgi:hypothetical protein
MNNTQRIKIDILNNKVYEYIYTKQYDIGRLVIFTITEDGEPLSLDGYDVVFQLKKPDGTVIIECTDESTCFVKDGDVVNLILNDNMTCLSGKLKYQLSVVDGEKTISTVTGYILCDKAAVQRDDVRSSTGGNLVDELYEIYENNLFAPQLVTLQRSDWLPLGYQAVAVPHVISNELAQLVIVRPKTGYVEDYINCGIMCIEQNEGELKFSCTTIPDRDIDVIVLTQGIESRNGNVAIIYSETEPQSFEGDVWTQGWQ